MYKPLQISAAPLHVFLVTYAPSSSTRGDSETNGRGKEPHIILSNVMRNKYYTLAIYVQVFNYILKIVLITY